ncbi:hypothetical protein C2E23DRAFT_858056 [Lenzites betulinus]|nr:hypothetical protein C2E23DRAFT_858056 [Lenzites betulinus]
MADSLPIPLAIALASRPVAVRTSPTRPPPLVQALSDKAQQCLIRQAVTKAELEAEERDALRITAEEMCLLPESVAEFADLDGLSWDTPEAREELAQWPAQARLRKPPSSASGRELVPATTPRSLPCAPPWIVDEAAQVRGLGWPVHTPRHLRTHPLTTVLRVFEAALASCALESEVLALRSPIGLCHLGLGL